jgi:hypothetical protein
MEIGIDSFIATLANPTTGELMDPAERLGNLLEEVETADREAWMCLALANIIARNFSIRRRR